jgi:hypothetical protein
MRLILICSFVFMLLQHKFIRLAFLVSTHKWNKFEPYTVGRPTRGQKTWILFERDPLPQMRRDDFFCTLP